MDNPRGTAASRRARRAVCEEDPVVEVGSGGVMAQVYAARERTAAFAIRHNQGVVFENPLVVIATSVAGAAAVLLWRLRETSRPISVKGILLPPLGMSTGLGMFVVPAFRVPWTWALGAFATGALALAYPLIRSSKLSVVNGELMMQRSRAFLAILLGLAALRIGLRDYLGHLLPPRETASVFFLLAFGMIVRWRLWMYFRYRAIMRQTARR